jgi:peptidoglycan L-alanyl-D-glutamate endopeptidase CwlK
MKLSARDITRLQGVHQDLVRVAYRAAEIADRDFMITEGLRTVERQKQLLDAGASKTMKSRHITGHAFDVAAMVGGEVRWDWPLYPELARIFKEAARIEGVPIEWGGDWSKFRDGPHFQLPFAKYP